MDTTEKPTEAPEVNNNDDGTVTVKLTPSPDHLPDEVYNLVPHLAASEEGKKFLKKLAQAITQQVTDDWESMEPARERRRQHLKLLSGELDGKDYPFEDSANVHVPVMLERILRYVARLYSEIFPSRDYIFTAKTPGAIDTDRDEVITLHTNHQLLKEIPDFRPNMRKALMEFVTHGSPIVHSYRDLSTGRNRHEFLHIEEFCFPYVWKSTSVDMSDIPRKTRIIRKYKHELKALERQGVYAQVDVVLDPKTSPTWEDGPELKVNDTIDKIEGRKKPSDGKAAPFTLYETHCWYAMPGQEEETPVVVVIEPRTLTVLGLYRREEEDPKDRLRFEKERAEMQEYSDSMQQFQAIQQLEAEVRMRLAQPDVPPDEAMALQEKLSSEPPAPPVAPQFLEEQRFDPDPMTGQPAPKPVRRRPIEAFSKGSCIDVPDSKSMGWGIGHLLAEFNKVADTAASQFTDSATVANAPPIVMSESVQIDSGEMYLQPGKIHRVRGSLQANEVEKAIGVIRFPPANAQLLEVVNLALRSADGVSSAPEVLSGEPGKANETWRGISSRIEQAQKQIGYVGESFLEFLANIVKNNARLNSVFLDDIEIQSIIDPRTLENKELKIGRELYVDDFEVVFTADTSFSSKEQKKAAADEVMGMVTSLPPPLAMQLFPPSFMYEAIVRALKARGLHDMVQYLGPRPATPMLRPEEAGPGPGAPPGPPGGPPGPGGPGQPPGPPPGPNGPPGPPQGPPKGPPGPPPQPSPPAPPQGPTNQ